MRIIWRPRQIEYNREILKVLAGLGKRFWAWEIVIMFYEAVVAIDGSAEVMGMREPRSHAERRTIVEKWFPHLVDTYDELYGLSLTARYGKGYAMLEIHQLAAAQYNKILVKGITMR